MIYVNTSQYTTGRWGQGMDGEGKVVMKEVTIKGAIGVTRTGYANAIQLLESRRYDVEKMHTHDFDLRDAELAIRTLAREIEGEESIHSCLLPEQ